MLSCSLMRRLILTDAVIAMGNMRFTDGSAVDDVNV